jgi:hypothetical protein
VSHTGIQTRHPGTNTIDTKRPFLDRRVLTLQNRRSRPTLFQKHHGRDSAGSQTNSAPGHNSAKLSFTIHGARRGDRVLRRFSRNTMAKQRRSGLEAITGALSKAAAEGKDAAQSKKNMSAFPITFHSVQRGDSVLQLFPETP